MAGLIPQRFIDDLLERVDIVDVIERRIQLRKTGKNYSARCPFHEENTPSFSVNQEKQFYYCFGCGANGNAIGFLINYENIDFPQAVEDLATSIGLKIPAEKKLTKSLSRKDNHSDSKTLYAILTKVSEFYQVQLREHPEAFRAVNYLKSRGLTGTVAKRFQIGFAPPGWNNLSNALGSNNLAEKQLLEAGMIIKNESGRVYDRFRDRVVFPIRDLRGRVVAFGGRVLSEEKPKYLNSPETAIFHKSKELYGLYEARLSNKSIEKILVTEGYLDVIALAQFGINFATATLGTSTSQSHLERLFRICHEIVFCFDGDEPGRKAALRALDLSLPVMSDGRQVCFLFLPEGEDPDSLIRRKGKEKFQSLLKSAIPLEEYLFNSLLNGIDINKIEGRARYAKLALKYINRLPRGIFRELMLQELARRTDLTVTALTSSDIDNRGTSKNNRFAIDQKPSQIKRPTFSKESHSDYEYSRSFCLESALKLLLHQPDLSLQVDSSILSQFNNSENKILHDSILFLQHTSTPTSALLMDHWEGTSTRALLEKLLDEERLIPVEGLEKQFHDVLKKLLVISDRSSISDEIDKLSSKPYSEMTEADKLRLRNLVEVKSVTANGNE